MSKKKKTRILLAIYTVTIILCLGMVVFVDQLSSPHGGGETSASDHGADTVEEEKETEPEIKETIETIETKEESLPEEQESRQDFSNQKKDEVLPETAENLETEEEYKPPVVAVVSDVHYFSPELTDYEEAFETMLQKDDGKLVNYVPQLVDALTSDLHQLRPNVLILSGDLTLNGEIKGHMALAEKLEAIEATGIKVLVIPGNHDINNQAAASYFGDEKESADRTTPSDFYDIYRKFGYDQARSRDENSLSYVYELDCKNWLLMLDSAQYEPVNLVGGRIKEETMTWMEEQLKEAKDQGITVITIAHHNLLKESILYPTECTLDNSQEVISLLEKYQVPLYISGHLHLQRTKKQKTEPGENDGNYHIWEVVADSFAIFPCQYSVFSWTDNDQLEYSTRTVDVEEWARQIGSTDENLLNFSEYGTKFLTGVISGQISKEIKNFPEEQIQEMADLYGTLNSAYCAGIPIDSKEIQSEEAFWLWERNLPDSKLFKKLNEILKDTGNDHNAQSFKLHVEEGDRDGNDGS